LNTMKLHPATLDVKSGNGKPVSASIEEAPAIPLMSVGNDEDARKAIMETERLRLDLGCDRCQIAGFTSVDFNPDVNPDVVADVRELPFPDESADEIYASHVLEHLPYGNKALEEWLRVLKPGGMLTVVVPDINGIYMMSKHHGKWGAYNQEITELYVNAAVFGAELLSEEHPEFKDIYTATGHTHQQIFIHDMLLRRVIEAGFVHAHESPDTLLGPVGIGNTCVIAYKRLEGDPNG